MHPKRPQIRGLDEFAGKTFHSAEWDHGHDLRERRVGVIGSAASAVQFVPVIAPDVARLYVFQRTPNWVLPKDGAPYTEDHKKGLQRAP